MQTTTATWRSMYASPSARLRVKAVVGETEYTDIEPPVIQRALMSGGVTVGSCVSAALTLVLHTDNSTTENIPRSAELALSMWWEEADGSVSEELPVGTFFVAKRSYNTRAQKMTLECYDAMLKANALYTEAGIAEWPVTMRAAASAIATAMGVELDDRTYMRRIGAGDIEAGSGGNIPEPEAGATMRDVLAGIAAVHGANWYITPAGKLRLKWIHSQTPEQEFSPVNYNTSDEVGLSGAVNGLYYDVIPGEEGDRFMLTGVKIGDVVSGSDDGIVVTVDSPYTSATYTSWLVTMLRNAPDGTPWWPGHIEGAIYDPAAELGDWLQYFVDIEDPEYGTVSIPAYTMLCEERITLGPAPRADVAMPEPGEAEYEYPFIAAAAQQESRLAARVDALESAVGDCVTTSDIENDLTATDAGKVLDARQGKALNDMLTISSVTPTIVLDSSVGTCDVRCYANDSVVIIRAYCKPETDSSMTSRTLIATGLPRHTFSGVSLFWNGITGGWVSGTYKEGRYSFNVTPDGDLYYAAWSNGGGLGADETLVYLRGQ